MLLIVLFLQLQVPLEVTAPLDYEKLKGIELSLSGDHQFTNAGLAVSLCNCWLQRTGNWDNVYQHVCSSSSYGSYLISLEVTHWLIENFINRKAQMHVHVYIYICIFHILA